MPPFLILANEAEYRQHFERTYCRGVITTHDGIRVFFRKEAFDHACFESSGRRGEKDIFSSARAQRMDWIAAALADPTARCFQGWNRNTKGYDATRRVAVVMQDFVVVIAISRKKDRTLKANFVTCYQAENSIAKIVSSPLWTLEDCENAL